MAEKMVAIEERIRAEGFDTYHIPANAGSDEDAALTVDLALSQKAVFVVVDGYQFGSDFQIRLKQANLNLLFIDDYGHADSYCADLVLNQNIYAGEELYKKKERNTELLIGPGFVLLRKDFWPWRNHLRINPDVATKILISLGGSDPDNATLKIVRSLKNLAPPGFEAAVVAGGGYAHIEALRKESDSSSAPIQIIENACNMPELMAWSDMALISGGTTTYEAAFTGLPCLIVIIAENQIAVAEKFDGMKAAVNLGFQEDLSSLQIKDAVDDFRLNREARESLSRNGRKLVDGLGAGRVIRAMLERIIIVIPANASDCNRIFQWANDKDTRCYSFNQEVINWDEHCIWLSQRLADPNCLLLICQDELGNALGVVRFDIESDEAVVSINLNQEVRGTGWSGFIIMRATDELFKRRHDISKLNAFIKIQNIRSIRAFERAGFLRMGPCSIKGNEAWHYLMANYGQCKFNRSIHQELLR
jgi:UDP-2,4-diacetamido-2,4,6-trideoxy-beta-L-altropyranose hydrolase